MLVTVLDLIKAITVDLVLIKLMVIAGCGFTKTLTEFYEIFTTYEKARIYMTEQLSRYSNEQIICDTENEQLSLF